MRFFDVLYAGCSRFSPRNVRWIWSVVAIVGLGGCVGHAQSGAGERVTIPAGAALTVRLVRHIPMRVGESLRTTLTYPVFVDNRLVLPAGTVVLGTVVSLDSDGSRRMDARLNADFTPYHRPVVQFTGAELANGTVLPLATTTATDGAPAIHVAPSKGGRNSSFFQQQWAAFLRQVDQAKEAVTAPGKGDRLLQLLYSQLPYHPERIETGTAWICELAGPMDFPQPASSPVQLPSATAAAGSQGEGPLLLLHAYLDEPLSSAATKTGGQFHATVAEPIRDASDAVVVPEGAILIGSVTRASRAKTFGRAGILRFNFRQLEMPNGQKEQIIGALAGADAKAGDSLQMDSEGGVKQQPHDKVLVPLALTLLASRSLDGDSNQLGSAAVGSNGMGLIGRVVGITGGSRDLAAGIGFYGTAISVYRRWIRRGKDVVFPKNNRIDIEISRRTGQQLMQP